MSYLRTLCLAALVLTAASVARAESSRETNSSPATATSNDNAQNAKGPQIARRPTVVRAQPAPKSNEEKSTGPRTVTAQPAQRPQTQPQPQPQPRTPSRTGTAEDVLSTKETMPLAEPEIKPGDEATIRFQFDGVPYTQVVRRFAQMAGKPLIGDVGVDGSLTFFDAQPYTYEEALDTLNILLAMRGYVLREEGRFLRMRPLAEIASTTKILQGLQEADKTDVRPNEIVTVVLPLKFLDPNAAAKTIARMVSSFGTVAPLGQGKAVVVTDKLDNIRRIEELFQSLDVETLVDRQLQTYFLKNANAREVAEIIGHLFGENAARKWRYDPKQKRLVPGGVDPADVVQVSHDERTNMVVLMGTGDKLALAEDMITTLDAAEGPTTSDMRIFELENARADEIAETVKELMRQGRRGRRNEDQETRVVADSATNRLVVTAAVDEMKKVAELVRELDAASTDRETMRVFKLEVADARLLAGTLNQAIVRRDAHGRAHRTLATSADTRTNSLIVSGPAADIEAATQLIKELDQKDPAETDLEIHVVQLEAGNVYQVSTALNRILTDRAQERDRSAPQPRIEVESETNSLIIATTPEDWAMVQDLLKEINAAAEISVPVTRMVRLQHVQAEELARTLQMAVRSRNWGRRGPGAVPINVVASEANNVLLITATSTDQAEMAQMIESLDVPDAGETQPFAMIRLQTADADELADKIRSLMPEDTRGRNADVFIEADRLTNAVLLRAPEAKRQRIEDIISQLDEATQADARETRIVTLENTSASEMQTMLQELYTEGGGRRRWYGRSTQEDPERVVITAAPHDKALIIEAPKKRIEPILQLAKTLDAEGEIGQVQVRTYQLEAGNASDMARSLSRLFWRRRTRGGSSTPDPRFEADSGSNQLMVAATPADFEEIEKLITQLKETSKLASQTKTYKLQFAKAEEIAEMLQSMLLESTGRGRWGSGGQAATRVAAMTAANAVVVQGPPERLALAEELIASFDTAESATKFRREVRTYQLTSGNAEDIARSLARLFAEQQRGRRDATEAPDPRFEADQASNQLMVSATGEQFEEIDKIIDELQAKGELAYQTQTYRLKYAKASEIATMLENVLLSDGGASRRRWWDPDAGTNPLRISTVASANAVVVQGTPEKLAMAAELIQTFDTQETAELSTIRVVKLENAQAESLAQSVTQSLAERSSRRRRWGSRDDSANLTVTVTAEPNSNSVLVRGPIEQVEDVVAMIQGLDEDATSEDIQVRVYALENSNAKQLAESLREMFSDLLRQQRRSRGAEATPFSVSADERTNSLVVSTSPAFFAPVEQMIEQLDGTEKAQRDVELVFLENADAADVALQLEEMFRDRNWSERPVVQYDYSANTLTMIGNDADLKLMMRVVGKLDAAAARQSLTVRVVPLDGVRANKMAEMLQRIYGQMTERKVQVTDKLPAGAQLPEALHGVDPSGKAAPHVVRAMPPAAQANDQDDSQEDAPAAAASPAVVTAGTQATESAHTETSAEEPPPGETQIFQPEEGVVIAIDAKSNSLLLSGPRRDLDELEMLITELSWGTTAAEAELRVYDIENADPTIVAETLDELFNPQAGQQRGDDDKAGRFSQPNITIVPEPRTQRLIVRAKPLDFEVLEPVIKQLDSVATVVSEVRVFTLKNSEASTVAENLQQLFTGDVSVKQDRRRTPQDRRQQQVRQMIELQGTEGETRVDAGTAVSITANEQSNSVVVAAPTDAMKLIADLIEELDQSAAETSQPIVRLYPLKHADVAETVTALKDVFGQSARSGRGRREGDNTPPVLISGNEAASTVIVSAVNEKQDLIATVINDLDQTQGEDGLRVKVYPLEQAQANEVASALSEAMGVPSGRGRDAAAGNLRISAETSNNSVVVRATQADHDRIAALIADLDVSKTATQPVRTVPLRNADPQELAQRLTRLFAPAQGGRRGGPEPVVIEADSSARALMVRADDKTFEKIEQLARTLDATSPAGQAQQTLISLEHAQASGVAAALQQAFAPPRGQRISTDELVTVVPEPNSNSLIVTANQQNLEKVKSLVAKLDSEDAGGVKTEFILLQNAQAEDLEEVLGKVANATSRGGRGRNDQALTVSADRSSNALVLSGPAMDVARMMQMALELDRAADQAATGVYIIPLEAGDASRVASMVRDLYNQQADAARRNRKSIEPLAVSADDRANALVVASSKAMYEQVSQWVQQVEIMKPARGTLRVITVEHADPEEVKKAIDQLYSVEPGATHGRPDEGASGGRVETTVLPKQRAVMISADEAEYEAIKQVVDALEAAALENKRENRIFNIENASNIRVAEALQQMYRGRGAPDADITVSAMANSNAVVVAAPQNRMEEIEHLIQQLDQPDIAGKLEYRIYRLENAQPTKILGSLRQMLNEIQRVRPGATINVQADERTRSIIITAQQADFEEIEKLINVLDQAPAYERAEVLIVPLQQADAEQLAKVLMDMLRPTGGDQITPEARALQEQVRLLKVRSTRREDIPELDLTQPIKITADPSGPVGSNALIVSSTPDNLKALRAIIEVMDTLPITAGVNVKLIHLENADAASVMEILQDIFEQGKQLAGQPGTPTVGRAEPESEVGRALTRKLSISVDMRTNTLVLAGEEPVLALASVLANDLDREQGRVTTDVRLFRLKHADAARLAPILESVFAEGEAVAGAEGLQTQVTRLRTYLKEREVQVTEYPKGRAALTIQADPTTNILVVAARSDVMPLIADVVQSMDIPGAGSLNTVRIFPLVNADAARIAQVIESLYQGPNAQLVRDEDKPTVATDTRTNSLIISANEQTFSMIATLLSKLDEKTPIELRDIRLLPLDNADAQTVAQTLQEMMDARVQRQEALGVKDAEALRVILVADSRSNSIIVGGSAESYQIVKEIADKLDKAAPALSGQIQILPLHEGNAGSIATTLQTLFDQRYQAATSDDVRRQRPIILPDVRTNSLLIAANQDDSQALRQLLTKLDVKLTDPAVRLRVIPLTHNDAGVVGPTVEKIFEARLQSMTPAGQEPDPQSNVDIAYDALSNALIISASKENFALIDGLLDKIDVEPPVDSGVIEILPLEHADANRVMALLEGLLSEGLYKPGMAVAGSDKLRAAREKVSLAADMRTNVLIISASKENLAIIKQIIAQLDSKEAPLMSDLRVVKLENADAVRLGPVIEEFFAAKRQAELQVSEQLRIVPLVVVPDSRTNTLLLAGGKEYFDAAEAMISRLDGQAAAPATLFRVFELRQATASVLQGTLQRLFEKRVSRGEEAEPVTLIADARTNSLIVGASDVDMAMVESLVEQLDVSAKVGEPQVEVFPLSKSDAATVAETLKNLYRSQSDQTAGELSVTVDERINALLVQAGEADLKRIREIVRQLDREKVTRVTEIQVFTLENAEAEDLAEILMDVLTNKPPAMTQVSPNRQTLLQFIRETEDGDKLITNALQEGVLITPDRRTNSLVVSAPLENMPLLRNLIEALDSTSPRSAEIRVFTLRNADATRMAAVLEQLFRMEQDRNVERAVQYELQRKTSNSDPQHRGEEVARTTTGQADQAALNITVDMRTNSLIIGGTKQQIEMAAAVIRDLDASPAQDRVTKVYRPKNSQAVDIQAALSNFLDQERQRLTQVLGQDRMGAAQQLLESEVSVVAEENTNTLLISASPRYFVTLAKIIDELDQPASQVLIQALLAEVRLDNQTDFGMDWAWNDVSANRNLAVNGKIGVEASVGAEPLGFNVSITGSDLTFFLRALQQTGRLEVLSRPQVLAVDNKPATIDVGERVPLITSSRVTEQGDTINTIQYENIGLTLDVLPRIGSDGTVQMEVRPTISSVGTQSTPITEFASAVFINNRSAETTVTCYDGQTIIIGGLITTTDQDIEDKLPVLGDMPGVGPLFRRIEKVKIRDELMIFLTPRVLQTAQGAHDMTLDEFRKNETLRSLKTNHSYKEAALDMIRQEDLRREIRKGANRLPDTPAEVRRENVRQTIMELELLPEGWQPYDERPVDRIPGQRIPDVEAPNPVVEPGEVD